VCRLVSQSVGQSWCQCQCLVMSVFGMYTFYDTVFQYVFMLPQYY